MESINETIKSGRKAAFGQEKLSPSVSGIFVEVQWVA